MTKASIDSDQRDPEMLPDRALDEPFHDALATSTGVEKKNGGNSVMPPIGTGGERVPACDRDHGDEKLKQEERASDKAKLPSSASHRPVVADYGLERG